MVYIETILGLLQGEEGRVMASYALLKKRNYTLPLLITNKEKNEGYCLNGIILLESLFQRVVVNAACQISPYSHLACM